MPCEANGNGSFDTGLYVAGEKSRKTPGRFGSREYDEIITFSSRRNRFNGGWRGEWKTRQHGAGKRRKWRKYHLAIFVTTQQVVAETLTTNSKDDVSEVEPLLEEISTTVETNGAYDKFRVYERLVESRIKPIIPPRKDAKIKKHGNVSVERHERDEVIRGIREK